MRGSTFASREESEKISQYFRFKVILGVKTVEDRNTSLEPHMVALEFKTEFEGDSTKVTTNWKTDTGWQGEEIIDSDWLDKTGSK